MKDRLERLNEKRRRLHKECVDLYKRVALFGEAELAMQYRFTHKELHEVDDEIAIVKEILAEELK